MSLTPISIERRASNALLSFKTAYLAYNEIISDLSSLGNAYFKVKFHTGKLHGLTIEKHLISCMPMSSQYLETKREEALISISFEINELLHKQSLQLEKMTKNVQILLAIIKQCEISKFNHLISKTIFVTHSLESLTCLTEQMLSFVSKAHQNSLAAIKELYSKSCTSEKSTVILASLLYRPSIESPRISDYLDIIQLELGTN